MIRGIKASLSHRALKLVGAGLSVLERHLGGNPGKRLAHAPIFIIGAPRSGSTLLYQVLIEALDVGYLSNYHCRFFHGPGVVERLFRPLERRQPLTFTSNHGYTEGEWAPSECGEFWYRFFRRAPQYVPLEDADPLRMRRMRQAIAALVRAFDRPILFKNMPCALRLQPLSQALPEALFVVIRRHITENAHSLLKARYEIHGDYETWWSMEPPAIASLKQLPCYAQVVEQIRHIHNVIEMDRKTIGQDRFLDVTYENLCANTNHIVEKMNQFLKSHGQTVDRRETVQESFEPQTGMRGDKELVSRLEGYVNG